MSSIEPFEGGGSNRSIPRVEPFARDIEGFDPPLRNPREKAAPAAALGRGTPPSPVGAPVIGPVAMDARAFSGAPRLTRASL